MRRLWQKGTNACGPLHNFLPWKKKKKNVNSWIREVVNSETCEFVILRTREEVMTKSNQCLWPTEKEKKMWIREFVNLWIRNFENSWGGYDKNEPIILTNWKNCINFTKVYNVMCGSPNSTTNSKWYKFLTILEFFKQLMEKYWGFGAIKKVIKHIGNIISNHTYRESKRQCT